MNTEFFVPDLCGLRDVVATVNSMEQSIREMLSLSLMQALTMGALFRREERKPGVLAELVGLSPSGFSRVLSELESLNYIKRSLSTEDKRNILVELTAQGRKKALTLVEWERKHFPLSIKIGGDMVAPGGKR